MDSQRMDGIPTNISPGLQRELISAVERTGWTPELQKAAVRLPALLRMSPAEFEQFSAGTYRILE